MHGHLGGRRVTHPRSEGEMFERGTITLRRLLKLDWIYQRCLIGSVSLTAFFVNLRFFKSSDTANLIAGLSFIGAWLAFGMLRPTIYLLRALHFSVVAVLSYFFILFFCGTDIT
jgi:hypothetical protein